MTDRQPRPNGSTSALRTVVRVVVAPVWLLVLAGVWLVLCLCRGVVWLGRVVGFVVGPVVEVVTAWLGVAPVLPRVRRWRQHLATEWRAYRAGAVEGELMDGVWR